MSMTIDKARMEAHWRWGTETARPCAWITMNGKRAVGYIADGQRYLMGAGETWEEALAAADARAARADQ